MVGKILREQKVSRKKGIFDSFETYYLLILFMKLRCVSPSKRTALLPSPPLNAVCKNN